MTSLGDWLFKLSRWSVVVLGVTAVVLGRNGAELRSVSGHEARIPAPPRFHGLNTYRVIRGEGPERILDLQAGRLEPCAMRGLGLFDVLGCSPWRDPAGNHQILLRYKSGVGEKTGYEVRELGVARCAYPAGEVLERVAIDPLPMGPVLWFPDLSDRILFAAGDGRLYCYNFKEVVGPDRSTAQPRPVEWGCPLPELGRVVFIQDPCWPADPEFRGLLFVAIRFVPEAGEAMTHRLWWLKLSQDGTTITGAGRLCETDMGIRLRNEEDLRRPAAGLTRDGTPLLACLLRRCGRADCELWIAPLILTDRSGPCLPRAGSARKLGEGCRAVAPAFSPDRRWLYARVGSAYDPVQVHRFAID